MTGYERWSLLDLFEMGDAAASLIAAHRTGLLGALLAGGDRPESLATALGLDARATRLVLNILWVYGVVAADGESFRASDELTQIYLDHPGAVGADLDLFEYAAEFLRTGAPLRQVDGPEDDRGECFTQIAPRLRPRYASAARELAAALASDLAGDSAGDLVSDPAGESAGRRVLDVGAGSGVWGLALLEALPHSRLTAVDLPQVARWLRQSVASRDDAERVEVIAGGYLDVEFPSDAFDVVVLGNVLHLEPPPRARRLLERAAQAARPGGFVVIIDSLASHPYEVERLRALYALSLAMRTSAGRTYAAAELTEWAHSAGLTDPRSPVLASAPRHIDALTFRRPAGTPQAAAGLAHLGQEGIPP